MPSARLAINFSSSLTTKVGKETQANQVNNNGGPSSVRSYTHQQQNMTLRHTYLFFSAILTKSQRSPPSMNSRIKLTCKVT